MIDRLPPRILVVGADNFIGVRIAEALRRRGVTLSTAGAHDLHRLGPMSGIDAVVNAAVGDPSSITRQARAALDAAGPEDSGVRLVHLSSMSIYGAQEGPVDETVAAPRDLGGYAAAQSQAEALVRGHRNSVVLRLGCEYGPQCPAWSERIARLLRARRLGDLGAAGDGRCNLIYIDDVVCAAVKALEKSDLEGGVFNLAMRAPPTWNEYFTAFGIALAAVPICRISTRRLRLEARLLAPPLKTWETILQRIGLPRRWAPPPLTPSLLGVCRQDITLDVGRAEAALGMTWTPLERGLEQTAAALRNSDRVSATSP